MSRTAEAVVRELSMKIRLLELVIDELADALGPASDDIVTSAYEAAKRRLEDEA